MIQAERAVTPLVIGWWEDTLLPMLTKTRIIVTNRAIRPGTKWAGIKKLTWKNKMTQNVVANGVVAVTSSVGKKYPSTKYYCN